MTITITAPLVPTAVWNYGASVAYASAGIGQDLTVTLSPGNDATIVGVYVSPSPISAGSLSPPYTAPPSGAHLADVLYNGHASIIVSDTLTRANAHILLARWGGTAAATVTVTGEAAGNGIVSGIANGWRGGSVTWSTSSNSFSDVTGCSVTVATVGTGEVYTHVTVTYTGAPSLVGELRVLVDSQASDATTLDGTNTNEAEDLCFRTTSIGAGTHTVKVQARWVSGAGSVSISHCDMVGFAMQAIGGT